MRSLKYWLQRILAPILTKNLQTDEKNFGRTNFRLKNFAAENLSTKVFFDRKKFRPKSFSDETFFSAENFFVRLKIFRQNRSQYSLEPVFQRPHYRMGTHTNPPGREDVEPGIIYGRFHATPPQNNAWLRKILSTDGPGGGARTPHVIT